MCSVSISPVSEIPTVRALLWLPHPSICSWYFMRWCSSQFPSDLGWFCTNLSHSSGDKPEYLLYLLVVSNPTETSAEYWSFCWGCNYVTPNLLALLQAALITYYPIQPQSSVYPANIGSEWWASSLCPRGYYPVPVMKFFRVVVRDIFGTVVVVNSP